MFIILSFLGDDVLLWGAITLFITLSPLDSTVPRAEQEPDQYVLNEKISP